MRECEHLGVFGDVVLPEGQQSLGITSSHKSKQPGAGEITMRAVLFLVVLII